MIVTLIGSARFESWFHAWNEAVTLSGHCVFSLGCFPSNHAGEKSWYSGEQKSLLDRVHKEKIDRSDLVLLLNPFAYVGESTLSELRHARERGKRVSAIESWGEGCGINANFRQEVQDAAAYFGVPERYGSPVNTFHPHCLSPWDIDDLLPPVGKDRYFIVELVETRREAAIQAAAMLHRPVHAPPKG